MPSEHSQDQDVQGMHGEILMHVCVKTTTTPLDRTAAGCFGIALQFSPLDT
jgi:hypothetical protein